MRWFILTKITKILKVSRFTLVNQHWLLQRLDAWEDHPPNPWAFPNGKWEAMQKIQERRSSEAVKAQKDSHFSPTWAHTISHQFLAHSPACMQWPLARQPAPIMAAFFRSFSPSTQWPKWTAHAFLYLSFKPLLPPVAVHIHPTDSKVKLCTASSSPTLPIDCRIQTKVHGDYSGQAINDSSVGWRTCHLNTSSLPVYIQWGLPFKHLNNMWTTVHAGQQW